jgi:hypothetical protein
MPQCGTYFNKVDHIVNKKIGMSRQLSGRNFYPLATCAPVAQQYMVLADLQLFCFMELIMAKITLKSGFLLRRNIKDKLQ